MNASEYGIAPLRGRGLRHMVDEPMSVSDPRYRCQYCGEPLIERDTPFSREKRRQYGMELVQRQFRRLDLGVEPRELRRFTVRTCAPECETCYAIEEEGIPTDA